MEKALALAAQAKAAGEVPVGAVMVHEGAVVAEARNQTEAQGDPTAHAEMLCIQQAAAQLGRWRLLETTLYVTLEPCPMCAGALLQARVGHLVYAARSPLLGADGSWVNMLQHGRAGSTQSAVADPTRPHPFHTDIKVQRGVMEEQASAMLQQFFRQRRLQPKDAACGLH